MSLRFCLFCILSVLAFHSQAQPLRLSGQVFDTTYKYAPPGLVYFLQGADTLAQTPTTAAGAFTANIAPTGPFLIRIYASKYETYTDTIVPDGIQLMQLDTILLTRKGIALQELVVKSGFKSRISGDTVLFAADSFAVRQFDNTERLLEQIPGITIADDHSIFYNGIAIKDISVNGGSLAAMGTGKILQMLRGRDIELLKIYTAGEENTHYAAAPRQEKRLDIRLKEEAMHGYSGKIVASANAEGRSDNNLDISSFTQQQTMTASLGLEHKTRGALFGASDLQEATGTSTGKGEPTTLTAAMQYNKSLLASRLNIGGGMQFSQTRQSQLVTTSDITYLADGNLQTLTRANTAGTTRTLSIPLSVSYTIDAFSSISLSANTSVGFATGTGQASGTTARDTSIANYNSSAYAASGHSNSTVLTLGYAKTFKNGANITASFSPSWSNGSQQFTQTSDIDIPASHIRQHMEQVKPSTNTNTYYNMMLGFRQPINRHFKWGISWQANYSASGTHVKTYDNTTPGQEALTLNPLYSSIFKLSRQQQSLQPEISYRSKHISARAGTRLTTLSWQQQYTTTDATNSRSFNNLLPFANTSITLNTQSNVNLAYQLNATQPGIEQVQPIPNNTNPLKLTTGNPNLTQSLTHSFTAGYVHTSPAQGSNININVNLVLLQNDIVQNVYTDTAGRQYNWYYNQNGNYTAGASFNWGQTLRNNLQWITEGSSTLRKSANMTNQVTYTTFSQQTSLQLGLSYFADTTLCIKLRALGQYTATGSAPYRSNLNTAFIFSGRLGIDYSLPYGGITGAADLQYNVMTAVQTSISSLVCNMRIQKNITRSGSLVASLLVHDLLNQNQGFLTTTSQNIYHEERYNTIGRYWLAGVVWHFTRR